MIEHVNMKMVSGITCVRHDYRHRSHHRHGCRHRSRHRHGCLRSCHRRCVHRSYRLKSGKSRSPKNATMSCCCRCCRSVKAYCHRNATGSCCCRKSENPRKTIQHASHRSPDELPCPYVCLCVCPVVWSPLCESLRTQSLHDGRSHRRADERLRMSASYCYGYRHDIPRRHGCVCQPRHASLRRLSNSAVHTIPSNHGTRRDNTPHTKDRTNYNTKDDTSRTMRRILSSVHTANSHIPSPNKDRRRDHTIHRNHRSAPCDGCRCSHPPDHLRRRTPYRWDTPTLR